MFGFRFREREGLRATVIWSRSRQRNLLLRLLPTPTMSIISRGKLQQQVGLDLKKTTGNIWVFAFFLVDLIIFGFDYFVWV